MKIKLLLKYFSFYGLISFLVFSNKTLNAQKTSTNINDLGFIENVGQFIDQSGASNNHILYSLSLSNMNIGLNKNGLSYTTYKPIKTENSIEINSDNAPIQDIDFHRVDITFDGMNPDCVVIPFEEVTNKTRIYSPHCKGLIAKKHQGILYKNLYNHIDLEFKINPDRDKPFEYNFILHKDAKMEDIKMRYKGANDISLDNDRLKLALHNGNLYESIPASWYMETNEGVKINYQLIPIKKGEVVLHFVAPDNSNKLDKTLIIDPVPKLDWATYYGGTRFDLPRHTTQDNLGNTFITGRTRSTSRIHTSGAHQTTMNGTTCAFIAKFNTLGKLLWATYYGENNQDEGVAGHIGEKGNYYFLGSTEPDTGKVNRYNQFNRDGMLVKLDKNGKRIWATKFGGEGVEYMYGLHGDNMGNLLISGATKSLDSISTIGAHQISHKDTTYFDGFLMQFDTNGIKKWGTYLGGEDTDYITGCHTDSKGNIYASLTTHSTSNISTPAAHQTALKANSEAALAKFNSNGNLIWSTYFGGYGSDNGVNCHVDALDNVYLVGISDGEDGIATGGCHQYYPEGGFDFFLSKFDPNGLQLWGTYIGSEEDDLLWFRHKMIDIDLAGNIYLSFSTTLSSPYFHSFDGYDTLCEGSDAVLMKFNPSGQRKWGTYIGGENFQVGTAVSVDNQGNIALTGRAAGDSSLATLGTHQGFISGDKDAFIVRFTQEDYTLIKVDTANCDSIIYNGNTYHSSTEFYTVVSDSSCCDTVYHINLDVNYATTNTITESICGSFALNGIVYDSTGLYTQTIPNFNGCDSIITLDLTVNPSPFEASFIVASQLLTNYEVSMVNISQDNPDSVKWILPTSNSFSIKSQTSDELLLVFKDSGTYNIGLETFKGSCSKQQFKTIKVLESQGFIPANGIGPLIKSFKIYPNPAKSQFVTEVKLQEEGDIKLSILNPLTSQVLDSKRYSGSKKYEINYSPGLQSGIYIMMLETARNNLILRFVIE